MAMRRSFPNSRFSFFYPRRQRSFRLETTGRNAIVFRRRDKINKTAKGEAIAGIAKRMLLDFLSGAADCKVVEQRWWNKLFVDA
ncbi:MAG: hypothetical protein GX444_07935 [Myxococcales bacterium]|nr:hypothetical protein [Myxococcales bacterium]